MADTVFYRCTAVSFWIELPQLWRSYGGLLAGLLVLEAVRFGFDFAKFGKPASYHSYLAKTWGLVMAVSVVGVFALHRSNVLVPVALGLGILCDLEGLTMSVLLPVWRKDIKTVAVAWRLRRRLLDGDGDSLEMRRSLWGFLGKRRGMIVGGSVALSLTLLPVVHASAVEAGSVAYAGGSSDFGAGHHKESRHDFSY